MRYHPEHISLKSSSTYPLIMPDSEDSVAVNNETHPGLITLANLKQWQWWLIVAINISFILIGQVFAVILARFYYDQGGNSKWLVTFLQTAAFPIFFVPYIIFRSCNESSTTSTSLFSVTFLIYIIVGVLIGVDNMLFSMGLLHLSASTYSLICATQLAFNAIFSYFINSQKFTALIMNSVVVLSLSASLLAINDDSNSKPSSEKYALGFVSTLGASALYAFLLTIIQLTFQNVIKKETFSVVVELQIYTSFFATCVSIVGLFTSGEWRTLGDEMDGFSQGGMAYVLTLVGATISWQVSTLGIVGLIFLVSSLFSNVVSTLSLAFTPVAAVVVFNDKMNGVKLIAMLMGLWGCCTYIYQNYLDDLEAKGKQENATGGVSSEECSPLLLE